MRFHWSESAEILEDLLESHDLVLDETGQTFVCPEAPSIRFRPPAVQPVTALTGTPHAWLDTVDAPGSYVVVLVQAGASALGWFEDDDCVAHKAIKRYVKRGQGRAQTLHLKTKGKSRYGSRLRLQNARRQLEETNEKLIDWWHEFGAPLRVFASVPVRTWPELMATDPPPPFEQQAALKIRHHVHVPNHAELMRVKRLLLHGEFFRP